MYRPIAWLSLGRLLPTGRHRAEWNAIVDLIRNYYASAFDKRLYSQGNLPVVNGSSQSVSIDDEFVDVILPSSLRNSVLMYAAMAGRLRP